ncbi:upstream activation factor subunit spp27-like [Melia azedarach]|uniref:Upstream activation factor subunit spp27-like n=1 Tax=Melia azedarach TaxID=155640 RepID=A0ACC1XXP3_MELAZ|nr:upstream activation factor subunit spp27-like [Melia azedarach]
MAISSGVFSTTFLSPEPASSFLRPSSARPGFLPPTNLRMVRTVTLATASKPVTGKREPRGIMKPRRVSPEMEALVGAPEIPRTQALKQIWAYIKEHNLQDPENKKIIVCDEKLKKIFGGRDQVGFLEIAGLISPHFL